MQNSKIKNEQISMIVSDPWDFVTQNGSGPFQGKILKIENERSNILLVLDEELAFNDEKCKYFIASPRRANGKIDDIYKKDGMSCNLTLLSPEKAVAENPFDLSWWRGGLGLIASLKIE